MKIWRAKPLRIAAGLIILLTMFVSLYHTSALGSRVDKAQRGPPKEEVARIISSYVQNTRPDDGFVEVREGVWAKSSNYHGVEIDGVTYYYQLRPHQSFDPLSRGAVDQSQITVVETIKDIPDFTIVTYTIDQNTSGFQEG